MSAGRGLQIRTSVGINKTHRLIDYFERIKGLSPYGKTVLFITVFSIDIHALTGKT